MNDPKVWVIAALVVIVLAAVRLRRGERFATHSQRVATYERWGKKCAYRWVIFHRCTGDLYDPFEIDHQWPHSRGGRSRISNFQPLCKKINGRKNDSHNWPFVLRHGIPVVGWVIYLCRWVRAESKGRR